MMNCLVLFLTAALITARVSAADQTADPYMGDWKGTVTIAGQKKQVAVYLIPLGTFRYDARFVANFNQREPYLYRLRGELGSEFRFMDDIPFDVGRIKDTTQKGVVLDASLWSGAVYYETLKSRVPEPGFFVRKGSISGRLAGQFELQKIQRPSPNLDQRAPEGAVVLFDGTNLDQWQTRDGKTAGWKLLRDGTMEVVKGGDIVTKEKFSDFQLHLEFCLPYMPRDFGQARANSGVYLQTRYEVQILDSYGLEGLDNECGGFYQIRRPTVNMCAPPLQWQSYDITFHSARLGATGGKIASARVTIIHNGVAIHDNFELPRVTPGGLNNQEGAAAGILLQDHGNPVQYRNIWVKRL